jgi:hypothetical protein
MHELRYRQIHLDFHTSPAIPEIGSRFDAQQFTAALRQGHVDSVTCFAVCHHGWSYNETKIGQMHPHLSFDLLRSQFDAAKSVDVNVPVYITAGVNSRVAEKHPEWREITADGCYGGWTQSPLAAGFKTLCFNTPYLDYLCELIEETVQHFPNADGIFLDIIHQGECCCEWCMRRMQQGGRDPRKQEDRRANAEEVLSEYYRRTTEAARRHAPEMPVFHNSGHISRGRRDILPYFSHLEIESLPTGGWGYDHFPVSAKYCTKLGLDVLGMTGKFHTTWGEFGGYKHPNALRYECAAMIAYGAKCSVGDQLHPSGEMDEATYRIIGEAYAEVEAKEPWCSGAEPVAEIALLSSEAAGRASADGAAAANRDNAADTGASRVLLEEHLLFDVVDAESDLAAYKLIVLPDDIVVTPELAARIHSAVDGGAALLLSGASGIGENGFVFDVGASWHGRSEFQPDYVLPAAELRSDHFSSPVVMYLRSQRIKTLDGASLGDVYDPYFNRTYEHYCSHQHAPPRPEPSGFAAGVRNGRVVYLAHPVFSIYAAMGAVAYRDWVGRVIRSLLEPTVRSNLPSTARVALNHQRAESRYVLHLLYGATTARGDDVELSPEGYVKPARTVEVIEDLPSLHGVEVSCRIPEAVKRVVSQPEGRELPFEAVDGGVRVKVDELRCHEMIVLQY